jgi:dienelactone hydrolase
LARANSSGLKGAIRIHGALTPPKMMDTQPKIDASILVLHGGEDPVMSKESALKFAEEIRKSGS